MDDQEKQEMLQDEELRMDPVQEFETDIKGTQPERFLVVSTLSKFASSDVWAGICGAMRDMEFVYMAYDMARVRALFSVNMMFKDILATAVATKHKFTHVLLMGSVFFPNWVIKSIQQCGVKVCYWSLEDPHALDQNARFHEIADYYFTNEVKVAEKLERAIYLPTAGDIHACMPPRNRLNDLPEKYQLALKNDIVFCGNVYPARQKILEAIIPFCEEKGYVLGVIGITSLMEDTKENPSPVRRCIVNFTDEAGESLEGVVDHRWVTMMYGYSKIVLNFERDPFYEYNEKYSTNRIHKIVGESLNPRAYEIALCGGGVQLIDDKRKELFSGKSIQPGIHCDIYSDPESLCKKIEYYMTHEAQRRKMAQQARLYAMKNHTYTNRLARLVKALRLKEGRKDLVIKDIVAGIQSGDIPLKATVK